MKVSELKYQQRIDDAQGTDGEAVYVGAFAKYLAEVKDDVATTSNAGADGTRARRDGMSLSSERRAWGEEKRTKK